MLQWRASYQENLLKKPNNVQQQLWNVSVLVTECIIFPISYLVDSNNVLPLLGQLLAIVHYCLQTSQLEIWILQAVKMYYNYSRTCVMMKKIQSQY